MVFVTFPDVRNGIEIAVKHPTTVLRGQSPDQAVFCIDRCVANALGAKGIRHEEVVEEDLPCLLNETAFMVYRFLRDRFPEQLYFEGKQPNQGMVSATIEVKPYGINLGTYIDTIRRVLKKYKPEDLRTEFITNDGKRLDYLIGEMSSEEDESLMKLQRKLPLLTDFTGKVELKLAIMFNIDYRDMSMMSAELSRAGIAGYGTPHELVFVYRDMPY